MRVDDGVEQAPIEMVMTEWKPEDMNQIQPRPKPALTKEFSFMDKPVNKRVAKVERKANNKENTEEVCPAPASKKSKPQVGMKRQASIR